MEDQTRKVLEQQRLEKRVKIAERLGIAIFVSSVLLCWVFYQLTGPHQMVALAAVGVCLGCLVWQRVIWRDLNSYVALESFNQVNGLMSGLALANASGFKVTSKVSFAATPGLKSLSLLLQGDGKERPFATVYLSHSKPLLSFGSEAENHLKGYLSLRVHFDQETLGDLAVSSPSTDLS